MKQVFAKIAKIGEEVRAAEPMKIEFAARDLRPNAEKINSVILDMGFFNELQKIETDMSTAIRKAISLRDVVAKNISEFEVALKELGMSPSEFENHKFATRELSLLDSNIADAQKRLQALERAMGS
jgi:hypothetical protein